MLKNLTAGKVLPATGATTRSVAVKKPLEIHLSQPAKHETSDMEIQTFSPNKNKLAQVEKKKGTTYLAILCVLVSKHFSAYCYLIF